MPRHSLSIYQTGWLYLLLLLWGLTAACYYWGGFKQVEQLNRAWLHRVTPTSDLSSQIAYLQTRFEPFVNTTDFKRKSFASKRNLEKNVDVGLAENEFLHTRNDAVSSTRSIYEPLMKLIRALPDVPLVILNEPSESWLSGLQNELLQQRITTPVIVVTHTKASINQIELSPESSFASWWLAPINSWRIAQPEMINWRVSSQLIYTPLIEKHHGGLSFIWQFEDDFYLSAIGESIRQLSLLQKNSQDGGAPQILLNSNIRLTIPRSGYDFGIGGDIFNVEPLPELKPFNHFLQQTQQQPSKIEAKIIFVTEQQSQHSDALVGAVDSLLKDTYFTQNWWILLVQWGILLCGLAALYWSFQKRLVIQIAVISGGVLLALTLQYIAFTQMLWLSVIPTISVLLLFWGVLLGFQKTLSLSEVSRQQYNALLIEVLPTFYAAQKFESIQPFLMQAKAEPRLVSKVFDLAIEAEAKQNLSMAKKLLGWIVDSKVKHTPSESKLAELTQAANQENLSSTLVIEPGQATPSQSGLNVIQATNFGRYQVEGILGKGAMGIVYQGVDPKIHRHVAIKTLHLSREDDPQNFASTKERFFREAETAGNLSHANIVTIYDVGEEGDLGYIAMDLLTGAPLSEFVKPEHRLPPVLVYQLVIQITDALDYAHRQQVVHRDIKPGNIIYDDDAQRVTLTDFGIAYVSDNSKTRTGTIMGSPYYMSPEQVLGKRVDGRSDVFSLGVTLYQLLSGHLPFDGESIASVAYHITKTKQVSVRQWDSKLPASAARITNKALQKDLTKRYQTADEFKQALIGALKRDFKKAPLF